MTKPYADEAPIRMVGPLLILLLAAIAIILTAIAGLGQLWHVYDNNKPSVAQHQGVAPALEITPQPALQNYLAQKQRIASSYAWIDPAQHLARIPVDEAMQALSQASELSPEQQAIQLMGAHTETRRDVGKHTAGAGSNSTKEKP